MPSARDANGRAHRVTSKTIGTEEAATSWEIEARPGHRLRVYERNIREIASGQPLEEAPKTMSDDTFHRPEMEARFREQEAKTERRFAELLGELRTANAETRGAINTAVARIEGEIRTLPTRKDLRDQTWQIIGVAVTLFVAALATVLTTMQIAQQGRSEGLEIQRSIDDALDRQSP